MPTDKVGRHGIWYRGVLFKSLRKSAPITQFSCVLYFLNDGLESGGIVESEVGEDLAVDFDTALVDQAHELAVREVFEACRSVDTLNPERAEVALFILAVAVSVGKTFFPGVLGNGPYVTTASEVTAGEFQDFLSACT